MNLNLNRPRKVVNRREIAGLELERMRYLAGYRAADGVWRQKMIDALVQMSVYPRTVDDIKRFVTDWLEAGEPGVPTPRFIYSRFIEPPMPMGANGACPYCRGTKFEIVTRADGLPGAKPCRCRTAKTDEPDRLTVAASV